MKIHKPILDQLILALTDVFWGNQYADKTLEYYFKKNKKWGARDRRFFADNFYDVVRHWRKLWFLLGTEPSKKDEEIKKVIEKLWEIQEAKVPEIQHRAIEESIPDWLDQWGEKELGNEWGLIIKALNRKADVILRVNTLKISKEKLKENLETENIIAYEIQGYDDALRLGERKNVFMTSSFKKGFFEVQDASSQKVAPFMNLEPGMRVIDACAGAGGKSLHIAAIMKNKGKIISMDVHQKKLDELSNRAKRAGIHCIETRVIDATKVIKRLEQSADRLLLDVPCSGIGALRRNPGDKWKMSIEKLNELKSIQAEILDRYSLMTKVQGEMVYATCSLFPSENQEQIRGFMDRNPGAWEILSEDTRFPHITGFDGFYMARLRRIK